MVVGAGEHPSSILTTMVSWILSRPAVNYPLFLLAKLVLSLSMS